jgi:hypothetical protein
MLGDYDKHQFVALLVVFVKALNWQCLSFTRKYQTNKQLNLQEPQAEAGLHKALAHNVTP